MTTELALRNAAERAYLAAFLLTVNSQLAEAAVMSSIDDMDPYHACGEALFDAALRTAIARGASGEFDELKFEGQLYRLSYKASPKCRPYRGDVLCFTSS